MPLEVGPFPWAYGQTQFMRILRYIMGELPLPQAIPLGAEIKLKAIKQEAISYLHLEGMTDLTSEDIKWGSSVVPKGPSRLEQDKPFRTWLESADAAPPNAMNCWEAVLYAAYRQGIVDKNYIWKAIGRVPAEKGAIGANIPRFVNAILASPEGKRGPEKGNNAKVINIPVERPLPPGRVVVFGPEGQHVALTTGDIAPISSANAREDVGRADGHEIIELDNNGQGVRNSTIEDAMDSHRGAYTTLITWGPSPSL